MNILFLESSIPPARGGIQRVSWIVSRYLNAHGHDSYFAFWFMDSEDVDDAHKLRIGVNGRIGKCETSLLDFVRQKNIHLIINQQAKGRHISNALKKIKTSGLCKIVYCLHLSPDYTDYCNRKNLSFFPKLKDLIVRLRTGLDLYNYEEWNQYKISDIYILLSKTYKDEFLHHIKIKDSTKLRWINNPLSFPFVDTQSARLKQVLIIARMDERQKNLTAAMRIWREIERRGNNDWTLIMGGYGNDENMILDYAKSIGIKRMNFVGKVKDPRNLYIKSSIFMMTSNYEGFPMVLTEALQFGCVPLAFDTYTALHDMVNDGYNGYIIQNKDEKDYADKLESLMNNTSRIKEMSFNAINSSKKFSIDVIGQKWLELINEFNHDI